MHEPAAMELPATYKRLVGRHVGQSFRDVCEEETVDVSLPGEGEVRVPTFAPTGSATAEPRWLRMLTRGCVQVLVKVLWAGVNGGCETFRVRADAYTPCALPASCSLGPGREVCSVQACCS